MTHTICVLIHYFQVLPFMVMNTEVLVINPRHACAARVTVVGLCVRPLISNSLLERLLVLKMLSRTQWATKVKKFVGICLKPLHSRDMPRNRSEEANMLITSTYPWSAFSAWHTAKRQGYPTIVKTFSLAQNYAY